MSLPRWIAHVIDRFRPRLILAENLVPEGRLDPRFRRVGFLVEATSCEQLTIWKEKHDRIDWQPDPSGLLVTVGSVNGWPICVCFSFATLNGRLVAFWEATSIVVHHELIERWLDRNCSPRWANGQRAARTDAMNFHHVLHWLAEINAAA